MCAAGAAVVRSLLADGFLDGARRVGSQLAEGLIRLSGQFDLGAVRARGLLLALDLGRETAPRVVAQARDRGLLLNAPKPNCLRFMPALNTTPGEVEDGLELLRQIFSEPENEA